MENDRIISLTNLFQHLLSVQIYLIEKLNLGDLWERGRGGGEMVVEPLTKFSKRGALTRSQFLEGVARKEEGEFFQGVPVFT